MKSYLIKMIRFYISDFGSLLMVDSPEFSLFFSIKDFRFTISSKKIIFLFRLTLLNGAS